MDAVRRELDGQSYSPMYRRWVLGVLVAVYTSNFIDRTILSALAQPIKNELLISDWQIGLLGGLSFALFYSTLGVPIARWSEHWNRTSIITIALTVWSAMTALCGLATTYVQLLLCRVGVGIGEAGATPPAQSLISDYFPPHQRTTALSIYMLGVPLGSLLGAALGGYVAQTWGWRAAFFAVGLPGLVLAVLVRFTIKEPPRGHSEGVAATAPPPPLTAVVRLLWSKPSFRHLVAGITLASFTGYAMVAFTAAYFVRTHEMSLAQAGLVAGVIGGGAAAVGTLLGGVTTDRLGSGDKRWYTRVPAIGLALAAPLYMLAYLQTNWMMALALLLAPGVLHYTYLGPTYGLVQNMVEPRMRATATALLLLVINLIGLGLGPPLVGLLSDIIAASTVVGRPDLHAFSLVCGAQAGGENSAKCAAASAHGLKWALIASMPIFLWASLHYFRASRDIGDDLRR